MTIIKKIVNKFKNGGIVEVLCSAYIMPLVSMKTRLLTYYYKKTKTRYGLYSGEPRKQKVIVSLTSYPSRFSTLPICIKSIMCQSVKPDKIIMYLGEDSNESDLTKDIKSLMIYGLEIVFVTGNLKPHIKYYYAMQEYPNDIVITVDDDIIYEQNMISTLMKTHQKYPDAVSARRVHKIVNNEDGALCSYNDFIYECRSLKTPSFQLLATGCAGILYPPNCLFHETFDSAMIKRLCLNADDIWLKFMQLLNGTPVVWAPSSRLASRVLTIPGSQTIALSKNNTGELCHNDMYIENMQNYYNIRLSDYCD